MKKLAIRSLVILFAVVLASYYFGRTIETLSTAKARFSYPSNGRLLTEVKLDAKLTYKDETDVIPELAKKFPITINSVYFAAGNSVDEGDVIFDASINDFDKKLKDLNSDLVKKTTELLELDSKNAKFPIRSEKSDRYFALKKANEALVRAKAEQRSEAKKQGKEADESMWKAEQQAYDQAYNAYTQYAHISLQADEGFDFIVKRQGILDELQELESSIEELNLARNTLSEIKAEKGGIITQLSIKPAEMYDGSKALYKFNQKDVPPVLRAIVTSLENMPEVGDKATVKAEYGKVNLKVSEVGKTKEGTRYIDFALDEQALSQLGGVKQLLESEKLEVAVQKRAATRSTLIPASALREEGEGTFVYVVEYKDNGLLGSYQVVKKLSVTVLGKNDTQVALSDDFYQNVVDREDRPLKDGQRIMKIKE